MKEVMTQMIAGRIPVVYICSRFRGDTDGNLKKAKAYCRAAVDAGYAPISMPLLLSQFMEEEAERDLALAIDLSVLDGCDELWVCRDQRGISDGMQMEIRRAELRNIPIRYFNAEEDFR